MTVVVVIFLPLVLAYQTWSYYVFRRRVSREQFMPPPLPVVPPQPIPAQKVPSMRHRAPRHLRSPVSEEPDMAESYDVIVIGTGGRRRHARPPPGPFGQAHPAARTRGLAAP